MRQYLELLEKVLKEGIPKDNTVSLFGETLEFDLAKGFPLVTTREINYKAAFGELAAFVRGMTDVREFQQLGANFWNADCNKLSWKRSPYKRHEFDLGKIYGYQWITGFGHNQIERLVINLRINPTSRRHILTTFNPTQVEEGCLPPCYVSHQFYSDGTNLDLLVHQRSADLCIGVPYDIASFALFQSLIAKDTSLKARKLKIIFGDAHIYTSHFSGLQEQLKRRPLCLPDLKIRETATAETFLPADISILNYSSHSPIKYKFEVQP